MKLYICKGPTTLSWQQTRNTNFNSQVLRISSAPCFKLRIPSKLPQVLWLSAFLSLKDKTNKQKTWKKKVANKIEYTPLKAYLPHTKKNLITSHQKMIGFIDPMNSLIMYTFET